MDFLARYWYLLGGVIGIAVFAFIVWRMYKQGKFLQSKRWKVFAIGFGVLMLLSYPLAHVMITNSDAFATAGAFVRSNPEVVKVVGPIQELSLAWLGGSMEVSGDSGSAQLTLEIRGASGSTRAYIELQKKGVWDVTFARLLPASGTPVLLHDTTAKPSHAL